MNPRRLLQYFLVFAAAVSPMSLGADKVFVPLKKTSSRAVTKDSGSNRGPEPIASGPEAQGAATRRAKRVELPTGKAVTFAELTPDAPPNKSRLLLVDCIDIALRQNFGLAIRRIEESIARDDLESAWGFFEPEFFANGGKRFLGGDLPSLNLDTSGFRSGVATRVSTGATVELANEVARTDFGLAPDRYDTDLGLTIRQPLLRGGGVATNLLPVNLAKIDISQANAELRRSALELMRNVETAWWEVVFAYRERELVEKTLTVAEQLRMEAEARVKVGLASDIDILQANAALASRREDMITADQRIEDRMDDLLLLLGQLGRREYSIIVPAANPPIVARKISASEALELVRALPEYRIQIDNIRQRALLVSRAKNDALPTLDLTVGSGYAGVGGSTGEAIDRGFSKDHPDWQVLGEVRIPLGFRSERAQLRRAKSALGIEEMRRADLEQSLHAQIREAERALAAGVEKVNVNVTSLSLSEQQFEQLLAKFKEGLNTFREMQLAKEDVEEARRRALAAQLEAILASIRLARLDGTLPSRYNLGWTER